VGQSDGLMQPMAGFLPEEKEPLQFRRIVGHKFRFEGGHAIWLAEENVVEFHDEGGKLLKTVAIESDEKEAAA